MPTRNAAFLLGIVLIFFGALLVLIAVKVTFNVIRNPGLSRTHG